MTFASVVVFEYPTVTAASGLNRLLDLCQGGKDGIYASNIGDNDL